MQRRICAKSLARSAGHITSECTLHNKEGGETGLYTSENNRGAGTFGSLTKANKQKYNIIRPQYKTQHRGLFLLLEV